MASEPASRIRVRGARENNLKDISVEIPRDALVVFESQLAHGTKFECMSCLLPSML